MIKNKYIPEISGTNETAVVLSVQSVINFHNYTSQSVKN